MDQVVDKPEKPRVPHEETGFHSELLKQADAFKAEKKSSLLPQDKDGALKAGAVGSHSRAGTDSDLDFGMHNIYKTVENASHSGFPSPKPEVKDAQKPEAKDPPDDEKIVPEPGRIIFNASSGEAKPRELASLIDMSEHKTSPSVHDTFDIALDRSAQDPTKPKPTVAVLDNFKNIEFVFDGMGLTHGQISTLGAAKHGFSTIALDKSKSSADGASLLHDVSDSIAKGKLPLSKGDVLSVSMNDVDNPTFGELNDKLKKFGFKVSAESLANDRGRLINALQVMAKDPSDKAWQARAQEAVDSNKAITEIQAKGVEVVNSAGNDGPERLDLGFLAAKHRLASVDPKTGRADNFSEHDSLTEAGNGVLEVRRQEPGQYKFGDVSVNAADMCQISNLLNCGWHDVDANALNFDRSPTTPTQENLDKAYKRMGRTAPALDTADGHLVAVTSGTSYSNISYLQSQLERLTREKQAAEKTAP